jgi:DNA-binding GntR family transcriptional regulator
VARKPERGEESGVDELDEARVIRTIGADHVALREQVLTELRRRIVDGEYREGERLTETRLADDFGVSRNPVREALRVVEAEGFVQILPRRGAVVTTLDETAVRDLFAVRQQLETLAAGLAAERATPEGIATLRDLVEQAEAATKAQDFDRVAELNSEFHRAVIEVSGNRWLHSISNAMYHHVHWVFRVGAAQRAPHSSEEHVRLVDAIEAGDAETATTAARLHVEAAAQAALRPTA